MPYSTIAGLAALLACAGALPSSPAPRTSMKAYNMPLTWSSYGWLAEYKIGTPPQSMTAFVDWTWVSLYAMTQKCEGDSSDPSKCFLAGQRYFNFTASKTFRNETDLYPTRVWDPNHFFGDIPVVVEHASDFITVGPSKTRIVFEASDFTFKEPAVLPFDTVFGLSPVYKGDNASYQSPFYQGWVKNNWPSPYIAFHQCYPGSPDTNNATCGGHEAIQTLGGYNPKLVKGKIHWYKNLNIFPQVNVLDFVYSPGVYNYWTMPITEFSIGGEPQPLNATFGAAAVFDHASYGRGVPMSVNAYMKLVGLANGTKIVLENPPNNGGGDFYRVDCTATSKLPSISYKFAGDSKKWHVAPKDYVANLGSDVCVLDVRTLGYGDMIIGNFGETFARNKYIMFDFESLRVGIADLAW